jgi:hypothetical protein
VVVGAADVVGVVVLIGGKGEVASASDIAHIVSGVR